MRYNMFAIRRPRIPAEGVDRLSGAARWAAIEEANRAREAWDNAIRQVEEAERKWQQALCGGALSLADAICAVIDAHEAVNALAALARAYRDPMAQLLLQDHHGSILSDELVVPDYSRYLYERLTAIGVPMPDHPTRQESENCTDYFRRLEEYWREAATRGC